MQNKPSQLLTVREVQALLGLHRSTIYAMVAAKQIPSVDLQTVPGRRPVLRFDAADLAAWIAARKEAATAA